MGDYRVVCEILNDEQCVFVESVERRDKVYRVHQGAHDTIDDETL